MASEEFTGEIKVASRIIDYISSGLYHSPAACLKELVNNSYDADASSVKIYVKPDADRIIIEDDGVGMNRTQFVRHFERIAESHKRDESSTTAKGRPKIGKIGIGFIAANEICEVMEIYSTQSGSSELLYVAIDFSEMRKPLEERRREGDDIAKADYVGRVLETDTESHYTRIYLTRVRGEAQNILAGADPNALPGGESSGRSLFGLSAASIRQALTETNSWKDFDSYSETMLQIGLNVPVQYHDSWMPRHLHVPVAEFEKHVRDLGFDVIYDGTEVRKPIVFEPTGRALVRRFELDGEHVSAAGYFYAQHGTIKPRELQGLLVRIRNAAVGEYDSSFWGFSPSEASLLQRWVSAEVWADDRLEEAMNIDRRTLREAHPAFVELRGALHAELRNTLREGRTKLYQAGSTERREQKAQQSVQAMEVIRDRVSAISPRAAAELSDRWDVDNDPQAQRKLLRKYTVTEIYAAVADAARGVVSPEQLEEILSRLTRRFGR